MEDERVWCVKTAAALVAQILLSTDAALYQIL